MFEIVKRVDFCFGHRLMEYQGKCERPHGHNGIAEIRLATETLDALGMVADFRDVGQAVEAWIDEYLDHRMVLRRDDPLVKALRSVDQESFVMDENPTTENMAKLIFLKVQGMGFPVVAVTLWETPDATATYTPDRQRVEAGDGQSRRQSVKA